MKKLVGFAALLAVFSISLAAQEQEPRMSICYGPEWNMNARENFAVGFSFGFDFELPASFAVGQVVTVSGDFGAGVVLEGAVLVRRYLPFGYAGFFAQAELGAHMLLDGGKWEFRFLGALRGGLRIPLGKFYVEPSARIGYPFAYGIGAVAGIRM